MAYTTNWRSGRPARSLAGLRLAIGSLHAGKVLYAPCPGPTYMQTYGTDRWPRSQGLLAISCISHVVSICQSPHPHTRAYTVVVATEEMTCIRHPD